MTEITDYHALSEKNSFFGYAGERVSRCSLQGPSTTDPVTSTNKASRASTPLPSGSTDEVLMDVGKLDNEAVAARPRGTSKVLPNTFLGSGYGRNSYFTWRLRMSTLLVAVLSIAGIAGFWGSKPIGYGGFYVQNISYALAFQRTKTTECHTGTNYCGACDTIVVDAMLVYHVAPLLVIIGLPATGLRIFEPFHRRQGGSGRQKIQRSIFFQFCEMLSVVVLVFSLLVILYFAYAVFQGNNFYCNSARANFYVAFAVITFFANFVVLTYFARFREHLSMQLGAFKETDQTGGIRSRLQHRRSKYKSERTRVVNDLRKHL